MTVLHTGATKKYSENWAAAFGGKQAKPKQAKAKPAVKSAKKKAPAKSRKKKR